MGSVGKSQKTNSEYTGNYAQLRQPRNIIIQDHLPSDNTMHTTTLEADNSQVIDLSFNDNESSTTEPVNISKKFCSSKKSADILVQAMSQLDEKYSNTKVSRLKSTDVSLRPTGDTVSNSVSEELVVQGSPGFVRVTSNSISVRQPLAKKMKHFVFGKTLGDIVTPNPTSRNSEI